MKSFFVEKLISKFSNAMCLIIKFWEAKIQEKLTENYFLRSKIKFFLCDADDIKLQANFLAKIK